MFRSCAWLVLFPTALNHFCGAACLAEVDQREIRLIVRADDIGSSHAANLACIESYRKGIARSVEVMVPCPWFNEAVKMLEETPGLWLFVEHPGMDTPEMRAIGHQGYRHVAADRDAVTKTFTSEKVKQVIKSRRIKLLSYGDLYGSQ